MKLRTSYFNATVLSKDITRFFPVWGLYSIVLLLFITQLNGNGPAWTGDDVVAFMNAMLWVNLFYAGVCGCLLYGDLFKPQMCNALHAMPLRREGWLITHFIAGLLFSLVPNVTATLIMSVMLRQHFYLALIWLGAAMLQFLFFFGTAVFSVMCAGNRLGMAAVYLIINWLGAMAYVVAEELYEPLLYGIQFQSEPFQFFSPVFHMTRQDLVSFDIGIQEQGVWGGFYYEAWGYLLVCALIGVVMLALAAVLYHRRKLECTGDFVAWKALKPVFLVIFTLGLAVLLYAMTDLFGTGQAYLFLTTGFVVGFFGGLMLLERTVRIFRKKTILGFVVFLAVLSASLGLTYLDPAGIARYVPETEDIQWMRIYDSSDNYIYEDLDAHCYQITDPTELEAYRQIHRQLLQDEEGKVYAQKHVAAEWSDIRILYKLKDGSTVIRYYYMNPDTPEGAVLKQYLSSYQYLFQTEDWDSVLDRVYSMDISVNHYGENDYKLSSFMISNKADLHKMLEAIQADCSNGTMAQDWVFHPGDNTLGWIYIQLETPETDHIRSLDSIDMYFYPECDNIVSALMEMASEN